MKQIKAVILDDNYTNTLAVQELYNTESPLNIDGNKRHVLTDIFVHHTPFIEYLKAGNNPDIILLDIVLDNCTAGDVLEQIKDIPFTSKIILISNYTGLLLVKQAIDYKCVKGILSKLESHKVMYNAVEIIMKGGTFYSMEYNNVLYRINNPPELTTRELEVLELHAKLKRIKEIAETLKIEEVTVKKHLSNVKQKFGAKTLNQLYYFLGLDKLFIKIADEDLFANKFFKNKKNKINK